MCCWTVKYTGLDAYLMPFICVDVGYFSVYILALYFDHNMEVNSAIL